MSGKFFFVPFRAPQDARAAWQNLQAEGGAFMEALAVSDRPDDLSIVEEVYRRAPWAVGIGCFEGEEVERQGDRVLFKPASIAWVRWRNGPDISSGAQTENPPAVTTTVQPPAPTMEPTPAPLPPRAGRHGSDRSRWWSQRVVIAAGAAVVFFSAAALALNWFGTPQPTAGDNQGTHHQANQAATNDSTADGGFASSASSSQVGRQATPAPKPKPKPTLPPAPAWVRAWAVGDGSSGLSYCMEWAPVENAVRYELYVNEMGARPLGTTLVATAQAPENTKCFQPPDPKTAYELEVGAVNSAGIKSTKRSTVKAPLSPITFNSTGSTVVTTAEQNQPVQTVSASEEPCWKCGVMFRGPAAESMAGRDMDLALAANAQLVEWFGIRPKIILYLYPTEKDYLANGGRKGAGGVAYSNERLVVNWSESWVHRRYTMVHEMVHGFQYAYTGGYCTPNWVTEGLANYLADKIIWTKQKDAMNVFDIFYRSTDLAGAQGENLYRDFAGKGDDLNKWESEARMYDRANAEVAEQVKAVGGIEQYIKNTLEKCGG